jgi:hypothetical protein
MIPLPKLPREAPRKLDAVARHHAARAGAAPAGGAHYPKAASRLLFVSAPSARRDPPRRRPHRHGRRPDADGCAPALRPPRTLRRGPSRWHTDLAALGVPRGHGRLGPRGRSRVRHPPRALLRPQSGRTGAAHLRPRREGRHVPVRRRAPRSPTRSSSSPGCWCTSPTRATSRRGTTAGMRIVAAACGGRRHPPPRTGRPRSFPRHDSRRPRPPADGRPSCRSFSRSTRWRARSAMAPGGSARSSPRRR